jgi:hypothetical protein
MARRDRARQLGLPAGDVARDKFSAPAGGWPVAVEFQEPEITVDVPIVEMRAPMNKREPKRIIIAVAHDRNGTYRVIDRRPGLHQIEAGSLPALRRKLLPIVRAEITDDPEADLELQVQEIGGGA